jgi:fumarate hydratase class II
LTERRIETDSMGRIEVRADRYWGARPNARSTTSPLAPTGMPLAVVQALGLLKRPRAGQQELKLLDSHRAG